MLFRSVIDGQGARPNAAEIPPDSRHGTTCAQIIRKYNPEVEIGSIAILNSELRGDIAWLFSAIDLCVELGVDVVNLSVGSTKIFDIAPVREKIGSVRGLVFVCARSNGGEYTVPAFLPEVVSVETDSYYSGDQFSLENLFCVRASGAHDLDGQITPVCNSYATPLVAAKVCSLLAEGCAANVTDIYYRLYALAKKHRYDKVTARLAETPKVLVVDEKRRLSDVMMQLAGAFLAEQYGVLLMSAVCGAAFFNLPYYQFLPDITQLERMLFHAFSLYACDILLVYADKMPDWNGFDVVIASGVMTVTDYDDGRVTTEDVTDIMDDASALCRKLAVAFSAPEAPAT